MRILITGSKGQVGTELTKQGQALKHEMLAFDQDQMDITQIESVQETVHEYQPDIVINAAAYTAVDQAEQEVELAYAVNKEGAANLATACKAHSIPLLHISTDYIFDGKQKYAYREDDTARPTGVYGQSKWQGDQAIKATLQEHIILRVSWVFAAQGNNFVKTMLRLGQERDELSIVADQHGGPTCAADIAKTLLKLAQKAINKENRKTFSWGTYHYSGSPTTTWYDFAQEIFKEAQIQGLIKTVPRLKAISTEEYPTPATRPANSALDCSKIAEVFGIQQPDWRIGLNNVLKEWKKS